MSNKDYKQKQVAEWTPKDVADWVRDIGFEESQAALFTSQKIDGQELVTLTEDELVTTFGFVLGERRKFARALRNLTGAPPPAQDNLTTVTNSNTPVQRADPPNGKLWLLKHPDEHFMGHIPYFAYSDQNGVLESVKAWIQQRDMENPALQIFDVPGTGKSTTIYLAASQTKSSYVRIRLDKGVLGTANQLMDAKLSSIKSLTVSALQSLLAPICFGALARTFDQCSTMLEQKKNIDFRQISTIGMEEQSQIECVSRLLALINKINTITPKDTSFVLHIDEAHSWSVPSTFTWKAPLESVECKELHYYKLIVLSEVLEDLRSQSEKLKICITGTNTFVDRILRFASNFKCRIIWLGLITADAAKEICSKFLNLECLPPQQMDILMEQIGYNGRSIQYFLHRVREKFNEHSTSDNITFNTLLKCADEAYSEWLGIITNTKEIRNSNEEQRYTTLAQLMVVFAYPGAWRAVLQSDGTLLLGENVFPEAWHRFAKAGAFRVQVNADGLLLHPPKGFVLRWITETLTRRIHSETLIHFTAFALSASTDKIGGPGHWFEKAIAAELTLPTSPLYSHIICGIAGTNNLHPDPSVVMRPVIFTEAKIYTLAGRMQGVYCIRDLNQDHDRWVDGGFSLLDTNNSKVNVWLDMKTVTDENKLWKYVGEFFNHPLPLAKLSEVDANGQHQYVIIAGPLSFNDCVLPITKAIKNLEADDFKLYPAEENYSLRHVLENLVPQVLLAKEQGRQRTQIAPPPMHHSRRRFVQDLEKNSGAL